MNGGYASSGQIGQSMFAAPTGFETFLLAFITPALTAGALTIEREQRQRRTCCK